jgi:hypothetical protein
MSRSTSPSDRLDISHSKPNNPTLKGSFVMQIHTLSLGVAQERAYKNNAPFDPALFDLELAARDLKAAIDQHAKDIFNRLQHKIMTLDTSPLCYRDYDGTIRTTRSAFDLFEALIEDKQEAYSRRFRSYCKRNYRDWKHKATIALQVGQYLRDTRRILIVTLDGSSWGLPAWRGRAILAAMA